MRLLPLICVALTALLPAMAAPLGRLALVAGDGHPGLREGAAAQARFADPYGLAVAPDGAIWVSDGGANNRLRRIGSDGQVSTAVGRGDEGWRDGAALQSALHTPGGLAFDAETRLLIADTGNQRIRRLDREGQLRTLAGDGRPGWRDGPAQQARFDGPMGLVADAAGRVYVADTYNQRIRVIEPDGQVRTLAGGAQAGDRDGLGEQARFDHPLALALDATAGLLYVADARNDAIRRIELLSGRVDTLAQSAPRDDQALLRRPGALALDREGRLLVATLAHGRLLRCATPRAACVDWEELSGPPDARLARPSALAVDARGQILVADAAGYRIHRWTAASAGPVGPAGDRSLPDSQGRWPLDPQLRAHEVVGTLGEVRARRSAPAVDRHHLHAGLDVQSDPGRTVRAIADAKVGSPLATFGFGEIGEGLVLGELAYIHQRVGRTAGGKPLDPRFVLLRSDRGRTNGVLVRRGARFKAGEALGTVNAMAHVHLNLGPAGYERDPLGLAFVGFADHQAPRIERIELLDELGRVLETGQAWRGQPLRVVVEAWDQVDGNLPRRRLGVQRLSWQLLDAEGRPVPGHEKPQLRHDYRTLPRDVEPTPIAFAEGSGIQVQGARHTRMRYEISNRVRDGRAIVDRLEGRALPRGAYRLRVIVEDSAGNQGERELELVRN